MRTSSLSRISSAVALASLLGVGLLSAQDQGESEVSSSKPSVTSRTPASTAGVAPTRPSNIRVDKTLVLINVTVTDPLNRFVTGLEKEHFRLFEDKIEIGRAHV